MLVPKDFVDIFLKEEQKEQVQKIKVTHEARLEKVNISFFLKIKICNN